METTSIRYYTLIQLLCAGEVNRANSARLLPDIGSADSGNW